MSRLTGMLVALVTGTISWVVYAWTAGKFGSPEPAWVASALLLTIVVHELCHWAMMEKNGFKSHIFVLVILGGAFPDPKLTAQYEQLAWAKKMEIAMAGVIGNFGLMAAALLLSQFGLISADHLGKFLQLNAGVVLYNLLPLGILDGGRFAKLLFDSLPESRDMWFARGIVLTATLSALATFVLFRSYPFITLMLFTVGTLTAANSDDPYGSRHHRAMSEGQCRFWTLAYLGLMAVSMLVVHATTGYRLFK